MDRFDLAIAGSSAGWWKVNPAAIKLYPSTEAEIRLEFRPPRGPDLVAGQVPAALSVQSGEPGVGTTVAEFTVEVLPVPDVSAEISPRTSRALRTGRHAVRITNRGNAPWRAAARAVDPDARLRIGAEPETVEVAPGATSEVSIAAKSPRFNFFGRREGRSFTVELRPTNGGSPIALDGRFDQQSLIRVLPLAIAAGLLAVAVVAVGVLGGWLPPGLRATAPPTSSSDSAIATPAAQTAVPDTTAAAEATPSSDTSEGPTVDEIARKLADDMGLGASIGFTTPTDDGAGRYQAFETGVIYFRPGETEPLPIVGSILDKWRCLIAHAPGTGCPAGAAGPPSELGYPVARETQTHDVPYQFFDRGGIYCNGTFDGNGCWVSTNPVFKRWQDLLRADHDIGLPIRDVERSDWLSGGWFEKFDRGFLFTDAEQQWFACGYLPSPTVIDSSTGLVDCSQYAAEVAAKP